MSHYYYLQLSLPEDDDLVAQIEAEALGSFGSTGIMDFDLDEKEVDEILGERSYSGGDIPLEILDEVEETVTGESNLVRVYFDNEDSAKAFLEHLSEQYNLMGNLYKKEMQDWNQTWKENFKPIIINEELEILPSWYEEKTSQSSKVLRIYPGMGFGTGNHETTYLCLDLMIKHKLHTAETCFDFGCGSGILGLGHKIYNKNAKVDLYDIDQEALDNCLQNIELNKLKADEFKLLLPDTFHKADKSYDLVFANILKNVLLSEQTQILGKCSKDLVISGLLEGQEEEVIKAYCKDDFKHVETVQKNDWMAVYLRRK